MKLTDRIYEDYFKESRLNEYRDVLITAKKHGMLMMGVKDLYEYLIENNGVCEKRVLLNRHDIDTSPKVARKMFEIEKDVFGSSGGGGTYYFRNSTIDLNLIKDIENFGYETGFHYETIANYEKKNKLRSAKGIADCYEQIQIEFLQELNDYRKRTKTKSETVSAHGDWINVKYGLSGNRLLTKKIRQDAGVLVAADDACLSTVCPVHFFDMQLLGKFRDDVVNEINTGKSGITILTHPRNWEIDFSFNTKENLKRVIEEFKYQMK